MVIEKVINNNIVSAYDDTGKEVVIMGRGIGFGTKPGREVAEQKISHQEPEFSGSVQGAACKYASGACADI